MLLSQLGPWGSKRLAPEIASQSVRGGLHWVKGAILIAILLIVMTKYRNDFGHVTLGPHNINMKSVEEVLMATSNRALRGVAMKVHFLWRLFPEESGNRNDGCIDGRPERWIL